MSLKIEINKTKEDIQKAIDEFPFEIGLIRIDREDLGDIENIKAHIKYEMDTISEFIPLIHSEFKDEKDIVVNIASGYSLKLVETNEILIKVRKLFINPVNIIFGTNLHKNNNQFCVEIFILNNSVY